MIPSRRTGDLSSAPSHAPTPEEAPKRYFKNRLGGLGQYYAGTFRDLGLTGGTARSGIRYTFELGQRAAEAMDRGVDADGFFRVLEQDTVGSDDLDELKQFCPCYLPACLVLPHFRGHLNAWSLGTRSSSEVGTRGNRGAVSKGVYGSRSDLHGPGSFHLGVRVDREPPFVRCR